MWSRKLDRKQAKIILHAVEAAGVLFICSLAPSYCIAFSRYEIARFPPMFCSPSKEISFYTICLPLCLVMAIGVILAVVMFWILHKVSG